MNRHLFFLTLALSVIYSINPVFAGEWYEGGTLHNANALEWQKATYSNKIATCGDFLARYMIGGLLNKSFLSKITTVDDFKPYAIQLANGIDTAFIRLPDDNDNELKYKDDEVAFSAGALIMVYGWANLEEIAKRGKQ